jgi:hypothetical protein
VDVADRLERALQSVECIDVRVLGLTLAIVGVSVRELFQRTLEALFA